MTLLVRDTATTNIPTSTAGPRLDHGSSSAIARREQLFAAIRLSRSIGRSDLDGPGAVVDFPTTVVVDGAPCDLEVTAAPGLFAEGHHLVVVRAAIGGLEVSGRFEISVGHSFGVAPAQWSGRDVATGLRVDLPSTLVAALPTSMEVPVTRASLIGAVRRAHLAAERARAELLETNRGLVRAVVNRFRAVVRAESASLDLGDLVAVGEHHLLDVVDRWFTDPDVAPVRDVAWSKLVQRAIGNALRSEIARATGISVEFRQLLAWFHAHPEDRELPAEAVAQRMAFAAGVTRVMSAHGIQDRAIGAALLDAMLARGEARYVPPARGAGETSRDLRAAGVFVLTSRSSLAEIQRAQSFAGTAALVLDSDDDHADRSSLLASRDDGYDRADGLDLVRRVIVDTGMTPIEALVWLQRTGALEPGGHATELPDIADDLGLQGRAEARAALRRARRKLDAWVASSGGDAPADLLRQALSC